MRALCAAVLVLWGPVICLAQSATRGMECAARTAAVSAAPLVAEQAVTDALQEARYCLEIFSSSCAEAAIADLEPQDLDADARGALALVRGDIAVMLGDFTAAEREYTNALEIQELHTRVRQGADARLGILYLRQNQHRRVLQHVAGIDCGDHTTELGFLEASAYFGLGEFDRALETIEAAIELQLAGIGAAPEAWYALHDASLRAIASVELYCETEPPLGSNIPVEQCYTPDELRQIAACQRTARARRSVNPTMDCRLQ